MRMTTKTVSETDIRTDRTERLVFYTNRKIKERFVQEAAKKNISVSTLLQLELLRKFSHNDWAK